MYEVVSRVRNDGSDDRVVVVEPWGMPLRLEPGHTFKLIARAPAIGEFEIVEESDGVVVYGWPGSTVDVFDGDVLLHQFATPVPPVPPNQSVKGFLDVMLGRDPRAD
jgi:hypothetical protein